MNERESHAKALRQPSCEDASDADLLTVAAARTRILAGIRAVAATERRQLADAAFHVLAEDMRAPISVPMHANSAVDGYALAGRHLPTAGDKILTIAGAAYAGRPAAATYREGACIRIMTGAILPPGVDTVIMQEHAQRLDPRRIRIDGRHRAGQNVRQAGEDISRGDLVLPAGARLNAAACGVLASLGVTAAPVRRKPRVAFFSTGDEVKPAGAALSAGELYDSNRYTLNALLQSCHVEPWDLGIVPDDPDRLRAAFQTATEQADMVITSGGVSVGDSDYTKPVLRAHGQIDFWKIAMKPGRPLTFGRLGDTAFVGLPGNPVAVMVTFLQFVRPALQALAGEPPTPPLTVPARAEHAINKKPGRREYLRARMRLDASGQWWTSVAGSQGSGVLTSMIRADSFIELPEDNAGVQPGDTVLTQPFAALF